MVLSRRLPAVFSISRRSGLRRFPRLHTSSRIHWPVLGRAERAWPREQGDFGVRGRDKGEAALTGAPARLCAAPALAQPRLHPPAGLAGTRGVLGGAPGLQADTDGEGSSRSSRGSRWEGRRRGAEGEKERETGVG